MTTQDLFDQARHAGVAMPAMLLAEAVDPDKPWIVYGAGCIIDADTFPAETLAYWRSTGRLSSYEEVVLPVVISSVTATPGSDSAEVTWTTSYATDSQVSYGLDANYGSSTTLDPTEVTAHTVALSGLEPETVYHYAVVSNSTASPDATFTTLAAAAP